jgi:hypothetical protein
MDFSKVKKYVFWSLVWIFIFSFFLRKDLRSISQIAPEVLQEPQQVKIVQTAPIEFTRNNYRFTVTPLYRYSISGLVVSKFDYGKIPLTRSDQAFPVDFCLIWGSNAANKVHQKKTIRFSQDCRWCQVEWSRTVEGFSMHKLSNNHLLVDNDLLEKKVRSILRGDQVQINGLLVSLKAVNISKSDTFNPVHASWISSVTREDVGAGACEVIYVQDVKILKKGHPAYVFIFKTSFFLLLIMIGWFIFSLFSPWSNKD